MPAVANPPQASTPPDTGAELRLLPASQAIPLLLAAHGGKLYGLGLRLCGSPEDAEELVQEIFLNAFRKWDHFAGRSKPTTWLYTIATRACTRKQRRRSGEPAHFERLGELLPGDESTLPDLPAPGDDPETIAQRRELQEAVDRALGEIPEIFRMPLILKDIADLSLVEIAAVLDLKPETVKTRIHRGRLALRKQMAQALPQRPVRDPDAPPICRALLEAKFDALDRGVGFPVAPGLLTDRCSSFFRTLDLTLEACGRIGNGELPAEVRRRIEARLRP
jgi:RNA polymerase sigma-70 factor (ECF subfamily)